MAIAEFTRIKIGDCVYICNRMNPLEAMEYGVKVLGLISPALSGVMEATKEGGEAEKVFSELSKSLKDKDAIPLLRQAIGQCFTPDNQSLADELTFNRWFLEHPDHLFHLGAMAVYYLVRPFIPVPLLTTAGAFQAPWMKAAQGVAKAE